MIAIYRTMLMAGIATLSIATAGAAPVDPAKPKSVSCINLSQLDHTDVIDDQTILFYMHGKEIWQNKFDKNIAALFDVRSAIVRGVLEKLEIDATPRKITPPLPNTQSTMLSDWDRYRSRLTQVRA